MQIMLNCLTTMIISALPAASRLRWSVKTFPAELKRLSLATDVHGSP